MDSGASHHVTANPQNMATEVPLTTQEHVFLGNGQGLPITSIGSASFPSPTQSNTHLLLSNMLLVPTITKNLVSVSRFAKDNHVYFEFHPTFCLVKSQVNNQVLLRGHLGDDGLYSFPNLLSNAGSPHSARGNSLLSS